MTEITIPLIKEAATLPVELAKSWITAPSMVTTLK
jgi:hypothetical protein